MLEKYVKNYGVFFIVDTAQSAGTIPIDFKEIGVNALAFTGHKSLLGPQGIGGFIIDDELNKHCSTIIEGGTGSLSHDIHQPSFMPDKFECGTLNIPGIVGLSNAINFINEVGISNIKERIVIYTKTIKWYNYLSTTYEVYGDKTGGKTTNVFYH